MNLKKLSLAVGIALLVMGVFATPALANTAEQDQKQELEVECETGSYGQTTTCTAKGTQEQSQKIVYTNTRTVVRDGRKIHVPVDTALDARTQLAVVAAVLGLGLLTLVAKGKLAR